jgi:lipopolysaccharide export system protein LptA
MSKFLAPRPLLVTGLLLLTSLGFRTPVPAAPAAPPAQAETGLVTIESDVQTADNVTGVITAIGNVRIVYPDRGVVATGRQAQYFTLENRIVISGDVDIIEKDGNAIRADRVTYLVDEERAIADPEPGRQVFSQLYIRQDPEPAAAPEPILPPGPQPLP